MSAEVQKEHILVDSPAAWLLRCKCGERFSNSTTGEKLWKKHAEKATATVQ